MNAPVKHTAPERKFRKPAPIAGTTAARLAAEDKLIEDAELPPPAPPVAPPAPAAAKPAAPARKKATKPAAPKTPVAEPAKSAPVPVAKEKPHATPWQHADKKVAKHVNLKFDGVTHAKMKWIVDNVPRMKSHQKLIEACLFDFIEALLAEHYKPQVTK